MLLQPDVDILLPSRHRRAVLLIRKLQQPVYRHAAVQLVAAIFDEFHRRHHIRLLDQRPHIGGEFRIAFHRWVERLQELPGVAFAETAGHRSEQIVDLLPRVGQHNGRGKCQEEQTAAHLRSGSWR